MINSIPLFKILDQTENNNIETIKKKETIKREMNLLLLLLVLKILQVADLKLLLIDTKENLLHYLNY